MAFHSDIIKVPGDHLLDDHRPSFKYQTRKCKERKCISILQSCSLTSFLRISIKCSSRESLFSIGRKGWTRFSLRSYPTLKILNYAINMPWVYKQSTIRTPKFPLGLKPELMCRILKHEYFTYSLNEYLLCIYYVVGTILGIGDTTVKNINKAPALMEFIL